MRSKAPAPILVGCLFIAGCVVIPGVDPTDLSSVQEETATRAEVETALGEPELSRATDEGRIDVYLYDRGAETQIDTIVHPLTPLLWALTPLAYAFKVDEQESYLTVVYDKQDRVVGYGTWPDAETPEDAITSYETGAELGEGVLKNHRKLVASAECGDHEAQYWLGLKYRAGTDPLTRSEVKSYQWLTLAGAGGHSTAISERDEDLAPGMTPDQIAEAERLVAEWEPNPAECVITATPSD